MGTYKITMICGLIACIGNIIASIIDANSFAMLGWIVALMWFPYDKVFALHAKSEGEKK